MLNIPVSTRFNRVKGKEAWNQNLQKSSLVYERVRGSLGPKGAYKMVTYNKGPEQVVKVSKDVIPTLEELGIQYPAIKILSEAAKMQRDEFGDGVSQFVIIVTSLLRGADHLMSQGVHRTTIVQGFLEAAKKSLEVLDGFATKIERGSFTSILSSIDCGRGLLTNEMSKMIIDAASIATIDGKLDRDRVRIVKDRGGDVADSKMIHGVVIKAEKCHPDMPDLVDRPRIAILSGQLGIKRLDVKMKGEGPMPLTLNIRDPNLIRKYREKETELKRSLLDRITSTGANVLLCQGQIDERLKGELAWRGIFAVEKLDKDEAKAVSDATGAGVIGDVHDISEEDLGSAEKLDVGEIEPDKIVTLSGCRGATFLVRGGTGQALDEMESLIKNSITALRSATDDPRTVPGSGATEMYVADELRRFALKFSARDQLAIERFADALEAIPRCLAYNNGLDAIGVMTQLEKYHADGLNAYGIDRDGCSDNVCLELAKTKSSIIKRAYEVAALMLRIDELLVSKEIVKFHKK